MEVSIGSKEEEVRHSLSVLFLFLGSIFFAHTRIAERLVFIHLSARIYFIPLAVCSFQSLALLASLSLSLCHTLFGLSCLPEISLGECSAVLVQSTADIAARRSRLYTHNSHPLQMRISRARSFRGLFSLGHIIRQQQQRLTCRFLNFIVCCCTRIEQNAVTELPWAQCVLQRKQMPKVQSSSEEEKGGNCGYFECFPSSFDFRHQGAEATAKETDKTTRTSATRVQTLIQ